MLATIDVLKTEKENYAQRVEFLTKFINYLQTNEYLEEEERLNALDKAYRLQNELDFKKQLINQRESQIKQIEEQEALKAKCIEELPANLESAKVSYDKMLDDLEKLEKTAKKTKEIKEAIKVIGLQADQVSEIIDGIEERFNNKDFKHVINDFRQLGEIIRLNS
jgi:DNA repair exonuclease SbcCD ATPase subunit